MDIEKFSDEYFQYKLDTKTFDKQDIYEFIEAFEVEAEYGEPRRWYCTVISYCKFNNKYYACEWEQGLTECQENEWYGDQPYEVIPVEYYKTILIKEWKKV